MQIIFVKKSMYYLLLIDNFYYVLDELIINMLYYGCHLDCFRLHSVKKATYLKSNHNLYIDFQLVLLKIGNFTQELYTIYYSIIKVYHQNTGINIQCIIKVQE